MADFDIKKEVNFEYPVNDNSHKSSEENNEIMDEDSIPEESILNSSGITKNDEVNLYENSDDLVVSDNIQQDEDNISEEIPESDGLFQNNQGIGPGQFEKSAETLINETEASEKKAPPESKNEGYFFDRQKVFIIVGVISIITIFFLVFILPMLNKDKAKNEKKMQQASKSWSTVDEWIEPANDVEEPIDTTPMNSSEQSEEEEEELPEVVVENEIDNDSYTSGKSKRPVTNNNEQQKSFFNVQLDNYNSGPSYGSSQLRGQGQPQNSSYPAYAGGSASAYTPSALNDNISKYMASLNGDNYERMNNQSGKQKFFDQSGTGGNYNWNSEYTLWKGTIIPAVLETSINTDLPGVVIATVTTNVYNSLDGKHLLIPQGSKLYAQYSSSISYGQNRVQVIWNTLIRPDGLEVNLGGLNGVDAYGASGYAGYTDGHPFEFLKALGLIACFSLIDTKLNNTIANSSNMYTQNILSDTYSEIKKLDNKIIDKALDVQPTIKIPNGSKVNLITNISMELPPLEPYSVTKKYVRNK